MDYRVLIDSVRSGKAPIPTFKARVLGGLIRGKDKRFEIRDWEVQGVKTIEDFDDLMQSDMLDMPHGFYIQIPGTEKVTRISPINFLSPDEVERVNLLPEEQKEVLRENILEMLQEQDGIMNSSGPEDLTKNVTPKGTGADLNQKENFQVSDNKNEASDSSAAEKTLDEMTKDDFARELIGMSVQFPLSSTRMQLEELYLNAVPIEKLTKLAEADGVKIKDGMTREQIVAACLKP